jgi:hypothetical protein
MRSSRLRWRWEVFDDVLYVGVLDTSVEDPFVSEAMIGLGVRVFIAHGSEFLEPCFFLCQRVAAPDFSHDCAYWDLDADIFSLAASLAFALSADSSACFHDASPGYFVQTGLSGHGLNPYVPARAAISSVGRTI